MDDKESFQKNCLFGELTLKFTGRGGLRNGSYHGEVAFSVHPCFEDNKDRPPFTGR